MLLLAISSSKSEGKGQLGGHHVAPHRAVKCRWHWICLIKVLKTKVINWLVFCTTTMYMYA